MNPREKAKGILPPAKLRVPSDVHDVRARLVRTEGRKDD